MNTRGPKATMYRHSSMKWLEGDGHEGLSLLCEEANVGRLVKSADVVQQLINESRVQVWRIDKGRRSCVIKRSTPSRSLDASDQILAENRAAQLLSAESKTCPLLVLPVKTILDPELGSISIAPYAGESVEQLRMSGVWRDCTTMEVVRLCKRLAICLLLTQVLYVDKARKARYVHKDIKLGNVCYKASTDLFLLVDYGAFSSLDKEHWTDCVDLRYITPEMAFYNSDAGKYAVECEEGRRHTTHHSIDRYQTALAVAQFFNKRLPAPIDFIRYNGDVADYCEAVKDFSWVKWLDTSPDAQLMPPEMKDWLAGMLLRRPEERPESAWEALQHVWLRDELQDVFDCVEMAQPGWQQMVDEIKQDLKGCSSSNSDGLISSGFISSYGGPQDQKEAVEQGYDSNSIFSQAGVSDISDQCAADAFPVITYGTGSSCAAAAIKDCDSTDVHDSIESILSSIHARKAPTTETEELSTDIYSSSGSSISSVSSTVSAFDSGCTVQ